MKISKQKQNTSDTQTVPLGMPSHRHFAQPPAGVWHQSCCNCMNVSNRHVDVSALGFFCVYLCWNATRKMCVANQSARAKIEQFAFSTCTIFDVFRAINILSLRAHTHTDTEHWRTKNTCIHCVNYGTSGCHFMVNTAIIIFNLIFKSLTCLLSPSLTHTQTESGREPEREREGAGERNFCPAVGLALVFMRPSI